MKAQVKHAVKCIVDSLLCKHAALYDLAVAVTTRKLNKGFLLHYSWTSPLPVVFHASSLLQLNCFIFISALVCEVHFVAATELYTLENNLVHKSPHAERHKWTMSVCVICSRVGILTDKQFHHDISHLFPYFCNCSSYATLIGRLCGLNSNFAEPFSKFNFVMLVQTDVLTAEHPN